MTARVGSRLATLALAGAAVGCIVVPNTATIYDAECRIQARKMTLEVAQIASLGSCSNQGCTAALVAIGAVAAASAVVSGSIVVAGNIVYWFEKQGRCSKEPPPAVPAP